MNNNIIETTSEAEQIVAAVMKIRELRELNRRLHDQRVELGNQSQEISRRMVSNDEEVSRLADFLKGESADDWQLRPIT